MLKKNVEGLEKMAGDYLQYRFQMYLHSKRDADWAHYRGACSMIEAIGGEWRRLYSGDETSEAQLGDIHFYRHWVLFPSDEKCKRLNFDAWAE